MSELAYLAWFGAVGMSFPCFIEFSVEKEFSHLKFILLTLFLTTLPPILVLLFFQDSFPAMRFYFLLNLATLPIYIFFFRLYKIDFVGKNK